MQKSNDSPIGEAPFSPERVQLVRAALDRIAASPDFADSDLMVRFLRHIVGETLEGRGARLKAYTVAVEGLGRSSSFDAQTDSSVRVLASRLRRSLAAYAAGPGRDEPVQIDLMPGSYRPSIRILAEAGNEEARHGTVPVNAQPPRRLRHALGWGQGIVLVAAALVVLGAALAYYRHFEGMHGTQTAQGPQAPGTTGSVTAGNAPASARRMATGTPAALRPTFIERATLIVEGAVADTFQLEDGLTMMQLRLQVAGILSRFDHVFSVQLAALPEKPEYASDILHPSYRLRVDPVLKDGVLVQLIFVLLAAPSQNVVWARWVDFAATNRRIGAEPEDPIGLLLSELGGRAGPVIMDRLQRVPPGDPLMVEQCAGILRQIPFFTGQKPGPEPVSEDIRRRMYEADDCLHRLEMFAPVPDARVFALRAETAVIGHQNRIAHPDFGVEKARAFANEARRLAPTSASTYLALSAAAFASGEIDAVSDLLRQAFLLNPYDEAVIQRYGANHLMRGNAREAARHFRHSHKIVSEKPIWSTAHAAFAFALADEQVLARSVAANFPERLRILRLTVDLLCAQQAPVPFRDQDEIARLRAELEAQLQASGETLGHALNRMFPSPSFVARVMQDIGS